MLFYLQLLMFSGLAFFVMLPLMRRTLTISLDFDWVWRVVLYRAGQMAWVAGERLSSATKSLAAIATAQASRAAGRYVGSAEADRRPGVFARTWPIGITALWIVVLLTSYIFFYYF